MAFGLCCADGSRWATAKEDLGAALQALAQADALSADQRRLQAAWNVAASASAEEIPAILRSMQGASGPLADNWLRSCVDAVAERANRSQTPLDASLWEQIVRDQQYGPRARRIAYEWLVRSDSQAPERLLPQMLDDPSLELRYDAVQRVMDQAAADQGAAADSTAAVELYQRALAAARDSDQVQACAAALEKLGRQVDLVQRLGFVVHWRLIGPFDNAELLGFDAVYPPESAVDFSASYPAKNQTVAWKAYSTDDKLGMVDLNKAMGAEKDAVAYAAAIVRSDRAQPANIRLACKNAPKTWFNGKFLGSCAAYHTGVDLDQFVYPIDLREGENVVLLKVCQNAKKQSWEQEWQFQLRVTDPTGGPVDVRIEKP